jgi:hypothetical protein
VIEIIGSPDEDISFEFEKIVYPMEVIMLKLRFVFCVMVITAFSVLSATTWDYTFGTGSDSYTTTNSSSTTYLTNQPATGGTHRVRVGNGGGGGFYRDDPGLVNFGTATELRIVAPTTSGSGNINKYSVYNYESGGQVARVGYFRTQIRFGNSTGGNADTGTFYFFHGDGDTAPDSFADDNVIGTDEAFLGMRWVFGTGGTLTTSWMVDNVWQPWANYSAFTFQQGQIYVLEFFMSNGNGNQQNDYACNGTTGTITTPNIDVWVNGTLVSDETPNAWTLNKNVAFESWMFYGENSTSNQACLFLDGMQWSNELVPNPVTYYDYYSKSTGNLDVLSTWGTNQDGSGELPTNFTTAGKTFHIRNNATPTLGANWTVSGTGSTVYLGDGINTCTFTIPSTYTMTGTINVNNAGVLNIQNTTYPTFGTLYTGSTVRYSATVNQTVFTTTYYNLSIRGTGTKTINGNVAATNKTDVGDGTNSVTFTIPSTFTLTSTVDVLNNGILNIENTTLPTLGTLSSGSTVRYNGTTNQNVAGAAYSILQIYGGGTKTLLAAGSVGNYATVGDGTNTVTFSVPDGTGLTGTVNVLNGNTLILTSTTIPTMGTLGTNSIVRYNNTGNQNVAGATYSYLQVYGGGIKTLAGNTSAGISTTVGDGTTAVTLTATATYALTGTVNVGASSTLNLENTTTPTLGTLGTNSVVKYAALGNQAVTGAAFQYLQILGTGTKTLTTANASAAFATPVGDGTNTVTFVIPAAFTFTGTIDVNNNGILEIENITLPTLGTLATGSTVRYAYAGDQNVTGTTYYNLDVDNGFTKTMQNDVTVTNLTFANAGTLALNSYNLYLAGQNISFYSTNAVFSALTATFSNDFVVGQGVGRIWYTDGSFTNSVDVTFTFPYATTPASMYLWYRGDSGIWTQGALVTPSYNLGVATVTVSGVTTLSGGGAKTTRRWTFAETDETLPVELSSFTAVLSITNNVLLQWITQSETNVSGYQLYRNNTNDLETATMLNAFIPATNTSQMQVYVYWDNEIFENGTYYYWLQNLDMDGSSSFHGPIYITVELNGQGVPAIPVTQGINGAYPNPFNPRTSIEIGLTRDGQTRVEVFNQRGQLVRTLFDGYKEAGTYTLSWDGTDAANRQLPSGMYYIRMAAGNKVYSRKVVLMK